MKFHCYDTFRKAIFELTIKCGYDIYFVNNKVERVIVICKENYGWKIHVLWEQDKWCFQIKIFHNKYECN